MSVSVYVGPYVRGQHVSDAEDTFNVSNSNFAAIMRLLGYEQDEYVSDDGCVGEFAGARLLELKQRVDFALMSIRALPMLDEGTEPVEIPNDLACTIIHCGRSPGYFETRLAGLKLLVDRAVADHSLIRYN